MIDQILTNEYFLLALTFGIYQGAKMLQRRTGSILLNPILIAIGLMIAFLTACDIPYDTYHKSGQMIEFWLKPAVVALGVPLYLQLSQIKKQILPILASQMMGCIVGIISVVATARSWRWAIYTALWPRAGRSERHRMPWAHRWRWSATSLWGPTPASDSRSTAY